MELKDAALTAASSLDPVDKDHKLLLEWSVISYIME